MILTQKKIVVIELNCINAEFVLEMPQDGLSSGGRLHFFSAAVSRNNPAKVATIGAANARLMDRRALSQKSWQDVLFGIHTVIGHRGETVGPFHSTFRVVMVRAIR